MTLKADLTLMTRCKTCRRPICFKGEENVTTTPVKLLELSLPLLPYLSSVSQLDIILAKRGVNL